jgi:hypothetical protein
LTQLSTSAQLASLLLSVIIGERAGEMLRTAHKI